MTEHDYNLDEKIKILFEGMPYYVMPRYKEHYLENDYEKFSLRILKNYIGQDSTFLDIGAHYGAFTLFAAKKCRSKVIALEPVAENFEILSENIKLNKIKNQVKLYNYAASSEDGEAEFNIPWASDSAGFYENPEAETVKKQKVTVKRPDALLRGLKIDFIKIDTEGHEIAVLDGLKETIRQNPNAPILIEANPALLAAAGHDTKELLSKLVNDFNKDIYVADDKNFVLSKLSGRINDWEKYIDRYANIFCLPKQDNKYALYVSPSAYVGGAEMAMLDQISALRSRNIVCHVVLPQEGELINRLIDYGVSYSVIENYTFWIKEESTRQNNRYNIESSKKITDIARDIGCDLIINNTIVTPWGYPAAKELKIPLVWMIHEFGDLDHGFNFSEDTNIIRKFILEKSDLVVCCSKAVSNVFPAPKNSKKLTVIYNIIDLDQIEDKSKEIVKSPFDANCIKLIMVGRISESKGQIVAIRALAELNKNVNKVELVIVGDGPAGYKKQLINEAIKLGVQDRVKYLGYKQNPYPYIKFADFLLVCSQNEAFGRMTAEAMSLGTTVIGSDSGGTQEMIVSGKTGYKFATGDVSELTRTIKKASVDSLKSINAGAKEKIHKMLDTKNLGDKLAAEIVSVTKRTADRSTDPVFVTEWLDCVGINMEENAELKKKIGQLEREKSEMEAGMSQANNEYQKIINSKSWALTKPLRKTRRIIRKDKN